MTTVRTVTVITRQLAENNPGKWNQSYIKKTPITFTRSRNEEHPAFL